MRCAKSVSFMTRDEAPRVMRLFDDPLEARAPRPLGPGAVLLPGFALPVASALLTAVGEVIAAAPLRVATSALL